MKSQYAQHQLHSIGDLLQILVLDFPDLTISKIRFLETEGLITPSRAPSGYRKFTDFDLSRIRYILQLQQDHYLPLRVIRDHLEAVDQGIEQPFKPQPKESLNSKLSKFNNLRPEQNSQYLGSNLLTAQELADAAKTDLSMIIELDKMGIISKVESKYRTGDIQVIMRVVSLESLGVPFRHLKGIKLAVDKQIALADAVTKPVKLQKTKQADNRAHDQKIEILNTVLELHIALLRAADDNKLS